MAKSYTVSAKLEAKDNASGKIRGVRGAFSDLGSFLSSGWTQAVAAGTAAFAGLIALFKSGIAASSESEDGIARLEAALTRLGPAADSVAAALNAQAVELQKTTRFSDDAVTSAQALLANMGLSAQEIPLATQAAADLAAALKIDLDSAAKQVGKTLNGVVSRDLRAMIPALGELDKAALKSGEGLKVIGQQFAGRASADAATFSGSLDKLRNSFDDLLEKLGESVTKNPDVQASFERLNAVLTDPDTIQAVTDFGTAVVETATKIAELGASIPGAAQSVGDFGRGLSQALRESVGVTEDQAAAIGKLHDSTVDYTKVAQAPAVKAVNDWIDSMRAAGEAARKQAEATTEAGNAAETAASQVDALTAANERASRIQFEQSAAQTEFLDSLKAAGITITDNEAAQKRQEEVIRQADLAYRDGRISIDAYNQVLEQAKQKIATLNGTLATQPAKLDASTAALKRNAAAYVEVGNAANYAAQASGQRLFGGATASERNRASITFASAPRRVDVAG